MNDIFIFIFIMFFFVVPLVMEILWLTFQADGLDCDELGDVIRKSNYVSTTNKYLADCIYPHLVEAP